MPEFRPSDSDRFTVARAAAFGMTTRQIASLILNPRTGQAISEMLIPKLFPDEIAAGAAPLIYEVGMKHRQIALNAESEEVSRRACEFILQRRGGPAWLEKTTQEVQLSVTDQSVRASLQAKIAKLCSPPPPRQLQLVGDDSPWGES